MIKGKLSKKEISIEKDLIKGRYRPANPIELKTIVQAIQKKKKDAVLNIRINSEDLKNLKLKAKRLNVPYQTFISEILRHYAA